MAYEEYFTNEDKPYSENLNDALLLLDAFDVTVPVKMPDMFSNGEFASNLNLARKCGVGIITLISNSGVTIGTNTITGTGEVVFRVYPNFNGFYKWQSIILQKTGTVNIAFRKPDGSSISASVGSDGTISENNALKQLLEVDLVLTLSNATISSILINFINNHTKTDRVSALLEASQLVNVDGIVATGNTEAVNGGTVYNALDNLHSTVSDEIDDLSDSVDGKLSDLSDSVDTNLALKEDKRYKVTTLNSSGTYYPSCQAVSTALDTKENLSNKITDIDGNSNHYPNHKTMEQILEMIMSIVDLNITPTAFTPYSTYVKVNGNITFSYISDIVIRFRSINKNTGEYSGTAGEAKFTESSSFTMEVKNLSNPDDYYYVFEVKYKVFNSSHLTLYTSPIYDKNGNVVG